VPAIRQRPDLRYGMSRETPFRSTQLILHPLTPAAQPSHMFKQLTNASASREQQQRISDAFNQPLQKHIKNRLLQMRQMRRSH